MRDQSASKGLRAKISIQAAVVFVVMTAIALIYSTRKPNGQRFEWLPLHQMSTKDVDAYLTYRIRQATSLKIDAIDDGEIIGSASVTNNCAILDLADLLEVQSIGSSDIPGSFTGIILAICDEPAVNVDISTDVGKCNMRFRMPGHGSVNIASGFYERLKDLAAGGEVSHDK